ncbi:hypothetical protein LCGC14_3041460, partial [marine sediment metagenome]
MHPAVLGTLGGGRGLITMDIDKTNVDASLAEFPVLIKLSASSG